MECKFSEFSYGYASIREAESLIAEAYKQAGAPVLPSLQHEETLGWDAQISTTVEYALFLQFKRVEYISRRHPDSPSWDAVGQAHYRFGIETDEHQHDLLLNLEADIQAGLQVGDVLYAAPTFHTREDFDIAYANGDVLDRSVLVSPSEFGAHDGRHHYVVVPAVGVEMVLSEPRQPTKRRYWEHLMQLVREQATASARQTRDQRRRPSLTEVEELLLARLADANREIPSRQTDAPVGRRIQRLAALLDCGLVLMTRAETRVNG